eukprot:s145_g3.t1
MGAACTPKSNTPTTCRCVSGLLAIRSHWNRKTLEWNLDTIPSVESIQDFSLRHDATTAGLFWAEGDLFFEVLEIGFGVIFTMEVVLRLVVRILPLCFARDKVHDWPWPHTMCNQQPIEMPSISCFHHVGKGSLGKKFPCYGSLISEEERRREESTEEESRGKEERREGRGEERGEERGEKRKEEDVEREEERSEERRGAERSREEQRGAERSREEQTEEERRGKREKRSQCTVFEESLNEIFAFRACNLHCSAAEELEAAAARDLVSGFDGTEVGRRMVAAAEAAANAAQAATRAVEAVSKSGTDDNRSWWKLLPKPPQYT